MPACALHRAGRPLALLLNPTPYPLPRVPRAPAPGGVPFLGPCSPMLNPPLTAPCPCPRACPPGCAVDSCSSPTLLAGFQQAVSAVLGVSASSTMVSVAAASGTRRRLLAQQCTLQATVDEPSAQAAELAAQQVQAQISLGIFGQHVQQALPAAVQQSVSSVAIR